MSVRKHPVFHFKQFDIRHEASAMKVGVDGVLLGAWVAATPGARILDVGCGCGLISMMLAQRYKDTYIVAIDTDMPSAQEAAINVQASLWADRINVMHKSFREILDDTVYHNAFDVVVSNPPFFNAGIQDKGTARLAARHCAELSPYTLARDSKILLKDKGSLQIILPNLEREKLMTATMSFGWHLHRETFVRDNIHTQHKRVMMHLCTSECIVPMTDELMLHNPDGTPTAAHRVLCQPFYINF